MAPTIFIKFCGFIVHLNPNNMTLPALPGKIPETRKIFFLIFLPSPNVVLINQLTNLAQIRYLRLSYKYLQPFLFYDLPLKIKKKRLSSVISNPLLMKHISLKLGHWALNARKHMRCARTCFFFVLTFFITQFFVNSKNNIYHVYSMYVCMYVCICVYVNVSE